MIINFLIIIQGYMNKQAITYKNDEDMLEAIKTKQRNITIIKIPMYLSMVGLVLPFVGAVLNIYDTKILTVLRVTAVACILIGFLLAMLCNKKMNDLREFIGYNIVVGILMEQMQVIDYMPSRYVSESFLNSCGFLPAYNRVSGSDYIHGIYRNTEFTYSNLVLKTEDQDYTAGENNMRTTITEFSGQFITVSLNKTVNGIVQIEEKSSSRKEDRDKKSLLIGGFDVNASDEAIAYSILTPQFISGLKKMGRNTSIQISGNMAVIARNNKKNLFEQKRQVKDINDVESFRQEFRKELSDILTVIDIVIDNL